MHEIYVYGALTIFAYYKDVLEGYVITLSCEQAQLAFRSVFQEDYCDGLNLVSLGGLPQDLPAQTVFYHTPHGVVIILDL